MSSQDSLHFDVEKIREQARSNIENGAIVEGFTESREEILSLMQQSLSTELVCTLRYRQNAIIAENLGSTIVAREFWEHAEQELAHADRLARRIALLGGTPDLNPSTMAEKSHAEYKSFQENEEGALEKMLTENLVAERIAVETYQKIVRFIGEKDPVSRRLFEDILEDEQEHADDIQALLHSARSGDKPNLAKRPS